MYKLDALEDPLSPLLMAAGLSFLFCVLVFPFYIKWLRARQMQQYIREEGPQSHAAKAKTPTMGGLCFILGIALVSFGLISFSNLFLVYTNEGKAACLCLLAAVLCGLIGFADDFGKIMSKSNAGISGKLRLILEFALGLSLGASFYFLKLNPDLVCFVNSQTGQISSFKLPAGPLSLLYDFALLPFLIAATSNALNLHDGMDGLAAGTSVILFLTLTIMLFLSGHFGLSWIAASAVGALLAFLIYNKFPAKIFMGDTGSLFIGALLAALVSAGGLVFWFILLALIYIVETISVISQVVYFKLTKPYTPDKKMSSLSLAFYKLSHRLPGEGKRLFRMAPIHHHFEAIAQEKGTKEWEVVVWFWVVQLGICASCHFFFNR